MAGYYRSLLKRGMSITEALKRVARALARTIYRELKAMSEQPRIPATIPSQKTEGATAKGPDREAREASSDVTPSNAQNTPSFSQEASAEASSPHNHEHHRKE